MRKFILTLVIALLWSLNISAQTFEAKVNRNLVPEGETFLLSVELNGAKTNHTPDFSVLNPNFTVYSVTNSYRTNIINGNVSQSQQWNLVLLPNQTGTVTIPSISLDNYKTNPVQITVGGAAADTSGVAQKSAAPRFKMEGKIDNTKPYVQQQINYTLTIWDSGGLQGEEPVFMAQNQNDWVVKSLGAPEVTTKNINGQSQREITFHYALFAQKSGLTEVPAVRFNGYYLTKDRRADPFSRFFNDDMLVGGLGLADVFATKNPVVLTVQPLKVDVLPAPAANGGNWWLPAADVKIYAEFSPMQPQFKVGEAVNRTIYVRAEGVADTQLPELRFAQVPGLKQYPEKPQRETRIEDGKIVAIEKITNVYILEKSGDITLPEISLNWFNIQTKTPEQAVLPAQNIRVAASADVAEEPAALASLPQSTKSLAAAPVAQAASQPDVYWLVGGAFALGVLLCLGILALSKWLAKGRHNYRRRVVAAAKAKDIRAVRDALLAWAGQNFRNRKILSLQDVDEAIDDKEFRCELDKLTEALYSKQTLDWNSNLFIRIFNKIAKRRKGHTPNHEPLPRLYK